MSEFNTKNISLLEKLQQIDKIESRRKEESKSLKRSYRIKMKIIEFDWIFEQDACFMFVNELANC